MSIRQRNAHFTDWAAVCKALHVNTESEARTALESSDNTFYYYVCYIKSTKEIYTHGQIYSCSGNDDLLDLINELTTEVVENEEVTARALTELSENKASRGEVEMFELSKQDRIDDLDSIRTKANNAVQPDQISNFVSVTDLAKVSTTGSYNDLLDKPDVLTTEDVHPVCYTGNYNDLNNKPSLSKVSTTGSYNDLLNKPTEVTSQTIADWGFITSADFYNELLNSSRLSFYCVEPVNVILNGETLTYEANSNVDITITSDDVYEVVPTSDNSITALTSFPGPLSTFYSWLEGVNIFSNIVFDMNDLAMYEKWNQGHQGQYHVQMAQYTNCIFWSDNPYISDINSRTNYTLYNSSQLPLCYSSIPENTFKSFYCAYGVTNDPNWSSVVYKQSFANATWATQVFSYYGLQTIGVYNQDSPKFNITLPKDCRGLMFAASSIENAGVFDAINVTNFGAKSGSWRDAFAHCYALTNLYIKNLKVSINISWSPISQAALEYIIDNAANTSAITISLSPHTYHQLSDTIKSTAASKNITLELLTVNASQDSRLAWLINNGDGTKVLSDNGNYISLDSKQDTIEDLKTIRSGAAKGATAIQPTDLSPVATSGNYDELKNKPTAVTETTVSDWGFTKNTGTVTNVKINGITKNPSNGVIDLGTVLTRYTPMTLKTADTAPLSLRWSPNQKYAYTGATTSSGTITFTIDLSGINAQKDNTWCLSFITGSTVPTINFGVGQTGYTIMWANGVAPTFETNTFYEISFKLVGTYLLGVCGAFKAV